MNSKGYKLNSNGIPAFEDLPLRKGDPHHSAWGLYGEDDELGTLNRLTDERVVEAAKAELKTGYRVSLNWPLDAQGSEKTFFKRQAFHHELFQKPPRTVNDDVWSFNSQISSQWDGLRHFGYQKEELFYGGTTLKDIHGQGNGFDENGKKITRLGIQAMGEKGIVGRGILIDYHAWRLKQSPAIPHEAFKTGSIKLEHLLQAAKDQGTEIEFGDILLIRSGYMVALNAKTPSEISTLQDTSPPPLTGVEQSEEMLKWIWENFSAVAGDQPSFECWRKTTGTTCPSTILPTQANEETATQKDFMLHEVLLAGWGCPIGELFDLEKLAEHCAKVGRYSFFVTSEVCNVTGGVASPPNILAIF